MLIANNILKIQKPKRKIRNGIKKTRKNAKLFIHVLIVVIAPLDQE